jgi:hypothetical protein
MRLTRRTVVWLIPALLTLHNAEEAFALRGALPRLRTALPEALAAAAARLTYPMLVQALVGLSVLTFGVAVIVVARPTSRAALWLLLALEVTVGINAIAHLASAALVFRGYGPGLATGILINAPFAVYCMRRAQREHWLSQTALRATVPAALLLHGPVLVGGLWLATWRLGK